MLGTARSLAAWLSLQRSAHARLIVGPVVVLAVAALIAQLVPAMGPTAVMAGPGAVTEFAIPTAKSAPLGITRGADGNVWFTESTTNKIGRITPAGVVTEFPIPTPRGVPIGIAAG